MEGAMPDWSSLPDDILGIIARILYLQSPDDDFHRFSAVCRSFRSSSSSVTSAAAIPSRTPNLVFNKDGMDLLLTKAYIYAIQRLEKVDTNPQESWVVRIEETNTGKRGWLSSYPFLFIDEYSVNNNLPKCLNVLDYRIKKLVDSYRFIFPGDWHSEELPFPCRFEKVAVSDSLDGDSDSFTIMGIQSLLSYTSNLFVWRNRDMNWRQIYESVRDIVYHNEKFYALTTGGQTLMLDSLSLSVTQVADCPRYMGPDRTYLMDTMYMVKSFKDLVLIFRTSNSNGSDGWHVCKLDEEKNKWVRVLMDEWEDRLFFLSGYNSFSLSAREFSGIKGKGVGLYFITPGEFGGMNRSHCTVLDLKDYTYRSLKVFFSKLF